MSVIRFVLIDDEKLVADSLAALLSMEEDLDNAGVFYSANDFLDAYRRPGFHVDVVITDLELSGLRDGIELAAELSQPCVLVSSHTTPANVKRALAAGVLGILPKTANLEDFLRAIRSAAAQTRYIEPDLATQTITSSDSPLTERESELLVLAGKGLSIAEIAQEAFLSPGTVRNYLSSAMQKVGAHNRFAAFQQARQQGWL